MDTISGTLKSLPIKFDNDLVKEKIGVIIKLGSTNIILLKNCMGLAGVLVYEIYVLPTLLWYLGYVIHVVKLASPIPFLDRLWSSIQFKVDLNGFFRVHFGGHYNLECMHFFKMYICFVNFLYTCSNIHITNLNHWRWSVVFMAFEISEIDILHF